MGRIWTTLYLLDEQHSRAKSIKEIVLSHQQSVLFYYSFHQIMMGIYEQVSEGVLQLQDGVSAQNHRAIC